MKKIRVWFCKNFQIKSRILAIIKKHYKIIEDRNDPEYIFCSTIDFDIYKYKNAVRICYELENIVPDFSLYDYVIGNAYIQYEDRYLRASNYIISDTYEEDLELAGNKHQNIHLGMEKRKFCCMVISNGSCRPGNTDWQVRMCPEAVCIRQDGEECSSLWLSGVFIYSCCEITKTGRKKREKSFNNRSHRPGRFVPG